MKKFDDISGKKFGLWKVIERFAHPPSRGVFYKCLCDCGTERVVPRCNLTSGKTKSCGCAKASIISAKKTKHGQSRSVFSKASKEYNAWSSMITRCLNPENHGFKNYGARGIAVCERWKVFENFYDDMGQCPEKNWSLDRIDPNGNYEPANCRWADKKTQSRNRRNVILSEKIVNQLRDGSLSAIDAINKFNCSESTIYMAKSGRNWK